MQREYLSHNLFIEGLKRFEDNDPHLEKLKGLKFVYPMDWWKKIDWRLSGIFILTGGRQIGKSTSTKLLIKHALENKLFLPEQIFYLPCDQIDDDHHLTKTIKLFLEDIPVEMGNRFLLIVDEVTFVKNWDRSIKALADEGLFKNGFCILTGSDSVILKEAASRFPGRRGDADKVDFHIHPLNFRDYVKLTEPGYLDQPEKNIDSLFESFGKFQKCGGYLRAINELHTNGEIRKATYLTFEQWIRGDFERRGKNVRTLSAILKTVMETSGTQITFSSLSHKMGQATKETFIDYVNLLERMDILFTLQAFDQNTKLGFPKKARKIHFSDPFILDTIERWLVEERLLVQGDRDSLKAELIVASQFYHKYPTYYLKADGEIDVVVVMDKRFLPIEVKWINQLRAHDLKQLKKYEDSVILTKNTTSGSIENIKAIPLPLFLVQN